MGKVTFASEIALAGLKGGFSELWKLLLIFSYSAIVGLGLFIGSAIGYALLTK